MRTGPNVVIVTSYGPIHVSLYRDKAPKTCANFLEYVADDFYPGTVFHRVVHGFLIQGGGFGPGLAQRTTRPPIRNEADNRLRHMRGTLAMARLPSDPHSATAQFFINSANNTTLEHQAPTAGGWGYCVFGAVTEGLQVVERIEGVPTVTKGVHENVPLQDIVIEHIKLADQ